jgi:type 1 glutamine amidotransferase
MVPEQPQGVCLDKAYEHEFVRELLDQRDLTPHLRSRGEAANELRADLGHRARRWVLERIHAWINRALRWRWRRGRGRRCDPRVLECATHGGR